MTLRIMLVGLVASLGLELPSGSDVSSWAQAGSSWVRSTVSSCSMAGAEVKLDLARPSDCHQADEPFEVPSLAEDVAVAPSDLAFEAASNLMTADLLADLVQPSEIDEAASSLAIETPSSVGLPEGEEVACQIHFVPVEEAVACVDLATIDLNEDEVSIIDAPERLDRLSAAVRLTREAVQAWADLLQTDGEPASDTR